MKQYAIFETACGNVEVKTDFYDLATNVYLKHAGESFDIAVINSNFDIYIFGKHIKIKVRDDINYTYISIIHKRVLVGCLKIRTRIFSYSISRIDKTNEKRYEITKWLK